MGINFIRLEWSQELLVPSAVQSFTLTVSNGSNSQVISLLDKSHHNFTVPKGDPPCLFYNFSVTASYFGATYTGAGCSESSPVLSRMLPSLPNIVQLESSLNYVLEKRSTGYAVEVSFEVCCPNFILALSPRPILGCMAS